MQIGYSGKRDFVVKQHQKGKKKKKEEKRKGFSPGPGIAPVLTGKTTPISVFLKSISDPQHPSVVPRDTAGVRRPGSFDRPAGEKGEERCEHSPSLPFPVLCCFVAEGAGSFHTPEPSHEPWDNLWLWSKHGDKSLEIISLLWDRLCGWPSAVTTGLFNLSAPQLLVSRLEMKLPLFHPCSGLSAEATSCWLRDEPCSCAEHSWGPAALRSSITIVITHKGTLNQGKEHLFPGREFSLFIPSIYWGGIHLWTAAGVWGSLGACLQEQWCAGSLLGPVGVLQRSRTCHAHNLGLSLPHSQVGPWVVPEQQWDMSWPAAGTNSASFVLEILHWIM